MAYLANAQTFVFFAITIAAFIFQLAALIDSLRYSGEVYRAADKRTKVFWTVLLGIAAAVGFLAMPPMSFMPMFISLLGFVAAAVYFVDVRKALRMVDPRYRNKR